MAADWKQKGRIFADRELRRWRAPRRFKIGRLRVLPDDSLWAALRREYDDALMVLEWAAEKIGLSSEVRACYAKDLDFDAMALMAKGFRERIEELHRKEKSHG